MNRTVEERQFSEVDTKKASAVREEVIKVFQRLFPVADPGCIAAAFEWVQAAFSGRYPDFQAIDAKYHDFEHTLQGTVCFVRLLEGYQVAGAEPRLTRR